MKTIKFTFASEAKSKVIKKPGLKLEIEGDVLDKMSKHEGFNRLIGLILEGVDEFMKFNDVKMDATLQFVQDPEWTKWVNLSLDVWLYIDDFMKRKNIINNLRSFIHPKIKNIDDLELYFDNIEGMVTVINGRIGV